MNHPQFASRVLAVAIALMACSSADAKAKDKAEEEPPKMVGLKVGRFMVRDLRPAEGIKVRLSFTLYAEVAEETRSQAERVIESHRHRIRNEVLIALRTSEQHEFQEPGLDTFRRRINLRLKRVVPALVLERLLIGEYEYFSD